MSQIDRPNALSEAIHLAHEDAAVLTQLRADIQDLLDLSAGCEGISIMAHDIFINTDPLMLTDPNAHKKVIERFLAMHERISYTLEILQVFYKTICLEEDWLDDAFFDADDQLND